MVLKVYGIPGSTCTARVYTTLMEKNVDFEFHAVDRASLKTPEYLAKQPKGQVPYIDDDGFILFESRAIAKYISEKYPGHGNDIYPSEPKARAIVDQWLSVETQDFDPAAKGLAVELAFKPMRGGQTNPEFVKEYEDWANKILDVYEKHLTTNDYLAGSNYSLADLVHIPYTNYFFKTNHADYINSRPHVKAWWERITSRESWQKYLAFSAPKA